MSSKNFKYLDDIIHSGMKSIVLDSDIILNFEEESEYSTGIKLDVNDLVIDGNGHTIDACGKTRIFENTGKNIEIKNIILKNGFGKENGGAIYNKGELTIKDSALNNNVSGYGGAIKNNRGMLLIEQSIINENISRCSGGAIFNRKGILSIKQSIINKNKSKNNGGALYNHGGELIVYKSTLYGNESKEGGAVYSYDGFLIFYGSTFYDNSSKYCGGAIYNHQEKDFKIKNCNFIDNKPDDIFDGLLDSICPHRPKPPSSGDGVII